MNPKEEIKAKTDIETLAVEYGLVFDSEGLTRCPFSERHNNGDQNPSLHLNRKNGRIYCESQGCFGEKGSDQYGLVMKMDRVTFETALKKLADRAGISLNGHGNSQVKQRITATFEYKDESGKSLYQVLRQDPGKNGRNKDFVIRQPNGNGGWQYTGKGVRKILYRLPDILKSEGRVVVCEGEGCVDAFADLGIPATCNPFGAGKWNESYGESLRERDVIIWPDKDDAGRRHAQQVAKSLTGKAKSIRIVEPPAELPDKGDIVDALKLPGWTRERVLEVLAETKPWEPVPAVRVPAPQLPKRTDFPLELPDTVWRGIVADYRDMLDRTTEAAEAYHLFTFLTCAGSMLGRRAYVPYGLRLYGNLYVAIVGKTGESRKTTSLRYAERTLREVDETWRILRGISSAEGLLAQIADPWEKVNGKGTVVASGGTDDKRLLVWLGELSSLLRKAKQDRVANIIPILTEAFDNPPDLHLPTKADPLTVTAPFISILAASTPSWLEDLQDRDVLGGFGNRFAYILGGPKEPIPFPDPPSRLHQARIVSHLAEVDAWLPTQLEVTLTGEARELWAEFYTRWHKLTWPDELFSAIVQRIPDVTLKIALLYAVLEKRRDVDAEILSAAIDAGGYAVASAQRIFTTFHQSWETKLENRILDILKDGAVQFGLLHRRVGGRYSTVQLNRTLDALTKSGQIWKQEQGNTVAFGISDEE